MKLEIRPRMCGKTRYLIQKSQVLQIPIVCPTSVDMQRIIDTAKNMGIYNLPCPIPFVSQSKLLGRSDECLVDDLDRIIQLIIKAKISEATLTQEYPSP